MMPRYEWVSVHEASRRLGRSVSTIRRQIESGELVGEREPLARGSTRDRYRVRLDAPESPDVTHHDAPPPNTDEASATPQDAPALTTRLLEMVKADRETIAALYAENAAIRERVGRAEERAERLLAEKEQWALDVMEQTERAVRAEAEAARLREMVAAAESKLQAELKRTWWDRLRGR